MVVSRRVLARHVADRLLKGDDRAQLLASLAAYIVEHKLAGSVDFIVADIKRNIARQGHVSAIVTSARKLDETLLKDVKAHVTQLESASRVELESRVDPDLLGGVIIETPSRRFDASVRTRLKRLRQA